MKEIILQNTLLLAAYDELSPADRQLVDAARQATSTSYAPYSQFCVGAALRLADGVVVTGSNQENAAYTNGICAERSAIFAAQSQYPDQPVVSIAIAAYTHGSFTRQPVSPCGACRQVMVEIENRYQQPIRILLYGTDGTYVISDGIQVLMPLLFSADDLNG